MLLLGIKLTSVELHQTGTFEDYLGRGPTLGYFLSLLCLYIMQYMLISETGAEIVLLLNTLSEQLGS